MKPSIKRAIRVVVSLPFLGTGTAWMLSSTSGGNAVFAGLMVLALGFVLVMSIGSRLTNAALVLGLLAYSYPLGELSLYVLSPSDSLSGFNKATAKFDPISGYRWEPGNVRYFKTSNNITVFDNTFHANQQGWIMEQDYSFEKDDSTRYRWMLLGNSFMAGTMLPTNTANRVQTLFNETSRSELYSFAIDGGGIMNWHQTFIQEIVPNYEFDGMVLCVYEDNLYRDLAIMQLQENECLLGRTDSCDWSKGMPDFSNSSAFATDNILYTDEEIDGLLRHTPKTFNWPFKRLLKGLLKSDKQRLETLRVAVKTPTELKEKMGWRKYHMLKEIIVWCKDNNRPLVLCAIPTRDYLLKQTTEGKSWHQHELELIANEYQLNYFDGYAVFKEMTPEEVNAHWLKYDGHWNQKGSDLFADSLAQYLNRYSAALIE